MYLNNIFYMKSKINNKKKTEIKSKKKIKIHLILPGGGVRGSYQGGFLYVLMNFFSECFEFVKIDSTSVGALNGTGLCLGMYKDLKDFWLNFNSINDIFNSHSNIPLIGTLVNAYSSYYNMGLTKNIKLEKYIEEFFEKATQNELDKIDIVVTNLSSSRYEYINGATDNFKSYLKASASPWILTKPTVISNVSYTDGALLQQFPLKNIGNINCDFIMIVGVDSEYFKYMYSDIGNNLFNYINKVLDVLYLQCNLNDYMKIMDLENKKLFNSKVYVAKYNLDFSPLDFNQLNINIGLNQGKIEALKFILENIDLKKFYKPSSYLNIDF